MTEPELARLLERQLAELGRLAHGLTWYHTHDSRRSAEGWPDYAIGALLPRPFVLYVELKAEARTARLTLAQRHWLGILAGVAPSLVVVGEPGIAALVDLVVHALNGRLLAQPAVVYRVGPPVRGAEGLPELAVPPARGLALGVR